MKRTVLYIGILVGLLLAPVEQMEVGKLIPVEVVSVYSQGENYVIETDTQNKGIGQTPGAALQNLKDTASGTIYLDTAKYLLLTQDAQNAVEVLRENLKPATQLSEIERLLPMQEVAKFLDSHGKLVRLKQWKEGVEMPLLSTFEDSYIFLKKVENKA